MQAPIGRPPPRALGQRDDVGPDALGQAGEPVAGAADAALHLVDDQQRAGCVAHLPDRGQEAGRRGTTTPPSPSVGSTMTAAVLLGHGRGERRDVAVVDEA